MVYCRNDSFDQSGTKSERATDVKQFLNFFLLFQNLFCFKIDSWMLSLDAFRLVAAIIPFGCIMWKFPRLYSARGQCTSAFKFDLNSIIKNIFYGWSTIVVNESVCWLYLVGFERSVWMWPWVYRRSTWCWFASFARNSLTSEPIENSGNRRRKIKRAGVITGCRWLAVA